MHEEHIHYSIVVPFYNEQENVLPLYMKISEVMDGIGESFEMIFIDDGSRDRTFRILSEIFENDRRVNVLRLRRNFGQTAALKAGFDFARGEVIISMDGDLQHDPEEIPQFIAKIREGYDIASGWRAHRTDNWLTRQLPSRIANWIMARLSGVDLHDFGTTFKAYRREVIQQVALYGDLHRFIPALASLTGATIAEVPIRNIPRQTGKSNYGLSRTIRVALDLISVKFLLNYLTRPFHFFGKLAFTSLAGGGAIGCFLAYDKFWLRQHIMIEHGPLLLIGILLIVSGIQFMSLGLIGEMLSRTYYESQNKPIYSVREVRSRRDEAVDSTRRDSGPWHS
ncbi:MAG: glycosyltransferase family 2 protein [Acidipila sp.]|nr:glycosyltransferase family 2 protein [Acidipila sp.]